MLEKDIEYYYKEADCNRRGSANGKYIKKNEIDLARRIAQRDYDVKIAKNAERRIKAIDSFLKEYEETDIKDIYEKIKNKDFDILKEKSNYFEEELVKITRQWKRFYQWYARNNHRKRRNSKVKIYPDFTILKMPQREEVYLEHFGLMDNSEYVESVLYKLTTYERNGIYPGINLFFTHETSKMPLNTRVLDGMLKELFCERE